MTQPHSRMISSFTVAAGANTIVLSEYDSTPGTYTATIPAGTYYMSDDGAADDFIAELASQLDTATGGTWAIDIVGVGFTSTSHADGRIKLKASDTGWTIDVSACTLPVRIIGIDVTGGDVSDTGGTAYTDWVHRYGWYPHEIPISAIAHNIVDIEVEIDDDDHIESTQWGGQKQVCAVRYGRIHAPFMTDEAAADNDLNTGHGLTVGDPNCSLETFGLDFSSGVAAGSRIRLYQDVTDTANYLGPYVYGSRELWKSLLADSQVIQEVGQIWRSNIQLFKGAGW